jgi:carbonic anhydrase
VVACSDSRVAPEVIFDTGLRDLFVTRIAGNLADSLVLGSLEYAVSKFKKTILVDNDDGTQETFTDGTVKLIVVLGHQECGAIKAACDALDHVRVLRICTP